MSDKWTFLSHHAHVLIALSDDPELTMDELARISGITTRSVVNVLNDLVDAGYLTKERLGRKNHYNINLEAPLRHQTSANRKVGDLIRALGQFSH
ncbi:MarR family transcriptional regulator [Aquiluna borgnonia]|jgi:DNA-binding IclR family transcriptional regulator|uniref:MarR family transcriptional regulator n=1 Tax=Aquiluna borgnonia TaxID=2499157 RepID=A0A7D4TS64_9MICO|nr:helix-turn-helix domain-containing protein [Aquiluna borgnonia]QKJ25873.1 MarR family transcriptional regulator [Aquiluna borgnonia]